MISQTVEYALRAAVAVAQSASKKLTAQEISQITRVPVSYLSKVLHLLVRGGIIKATRGIHGGYALTVAPDALSVLDVVNAIDPVKRIRACPIGLTSHGSSLCSLHGRLDAVLEQTEQSFGNTSIAELINCPGSPPLCEVAKSA